MAITKSDLNEAREVLGQVVRARMAINWRSNHTGGVGERTSVRRGRGFDYEGSADYEPGDDIRDIDWQAYAASDNDDLSVRVYRESCDIKSVILVDSGQSMDFGTARTTKRKLAAELAASVVASLDKTKDRVAVMSYSTNGVEHQLKSQIADKRAVLFAAACALATPGAPSTTNKHGLREAIKRLPRSRSLVFVVSDFINTSPEDWTALKQASSRHDVICLYVQDKRERELPAITEAQSEANSGLLAWLGSTFGHFLTLKEAGGKRRTIWLNKKTRDKYARNFEEHQNAVLAQIKDARCRLLTISTEQGETAFASLARTFGQTRATGRNT